MAWEKGCSSSIRDFNGWSYEEEGGMAEWQGMTPEGVLFVKVMTDEQMEVLRRQISIYATICEQLVEMHRAFTSQQESLAGMRLGGMYCNPSVSSEVPKITARQRWTPTPMQLQILDSIFKQGHGTPNKQKIAEITSELSNHGQVSEVKVYNWFQNKRARSKKKQAAQLPNNTESETEAEIESPSRKKPKSDKVYDHEDLLHSEHNITEGMHNSDETARSSGTQKQMSFFENAVSYPRIGELMGKMEIPVDFNAFQTGQDYKTPG